MSKNEKFTLRITGPDGEYVEVTDANGEYNMASEGFDHPGCGHLDVKSLSLLLGIGHDIVDSAMEYVAECLEEQDPQRAALARNAQFN